MGEEKHCCFNETVAGKRSNWSRSNTYFQQQKGSKYFSNYYFMANDKNFYDYQRFPTLWVICNPPSDKLPNTGIFLAHTLKNVSNNYCWNMFFNLLLSVPSTGASSLVLLIS